MPFIGHTVTTVYFHQPRALEPGRYWRGSPSQPWQRVGFLAYCLKLARLSEGEQLRRVEARA